METKAAVPQSHRPNDRRCLRRSGQIHLGIDPTLILPAFVLLLLFGIGSGLLVYLAMLLLVPLQPQGTAIPCSIKERDSIGKS